MLKYKRIGITTKSDLGEKDAVMARVLEILKQEGAEVCIDAKRREDLPSAARLPVFAGEEDFDLLLVLGGDGTILRAARELRDYSIPILSINRGAIGFMAELTLEEAPRFLPAFLRGEGVLDERNVLRIVASRGMEEFFNGVVLNEAVISQGSIARLVDLRTCINGEELTTFRADGLIIATPTGSTAYSLAAGGPIVHPSLRATILTPVNSHTFTQKPIVIPGDQRVSVDVMLKAKKFEDLQVSLTLDGQVYETLQKGDCIVAKPEQNTVKFLRRKQETFYGTLREKLKWGERPVD